MSTLTEAEDYYSPDVTEIMAKAVEEIVQNESDKQAIASRLRGMQASITAKDAEIARLRGALETIVDAKPAGPFDSEPRSYYIARAALAKEGK